MWVLIFNGYKNGDGEDEESFTKKPSVIEEIAYRDTWGEVRIVFMHDV